MQRLFLIVLVLVFLVGGGVVMLRHADPPSADILHEIDTLLATTLRCDDGSVFQARFSHAMDAVTISSEGEENVVPQTKSPNGKRYENNDWIFFFRGEGATVTNKGSASTTVCMPAQEGAKTPLNFGD